jgi:hypothetical protein
MEEFTPENYAKCWFYTRRFEGRDWPAGGKGRAARAEDVEARTQQVLREGRDGRAA